MTCAPKITYNRLRQWILAGYGQGHGENYVPWLQIKRWNSSPNSTQSFGSVPPFKRETDFLSRSEWLLALVFSWLGAEVREQFPLWPWPHPHPLYGLDSQLDSKLPWSSGLLAVCEKAGIEYGNFIGTTIPYVWTLDQILTIRWLDSTYPSCVAISVKPSESEKFKHIDSLDRAVGKLEIERRYCEEMAIPYFIADSNLYPGPLLGQLEWLRTAAYSIDPKLEDCLSPFINRFMGRSEDYSISEWIILLQTDFKLTKPEADYLIQHCLWHQVIDCDLSKNIDMNHPPKPGGRLLRQALRNTLMVKT